MPGSALDLQLTIDACHAFTNVEKAEPSRSNSPGRKFSGINLLHGNRAAFDGLFQLESQRFGCCLMHFIQQQLADFRQLDFGRTKHCRLRFGPQQTLNGGQVQQRDFIDRPAVRSGHCEQFLFRFRKSDIEDLFTSAHSLEKKLQRQGRLA